jgi:hypothetical protein
LKKWIWAIFWAIFFSNASGHPDFESLSVTFQPREKISILIYALMQSSVRGGTFFPKKNAFWQIRRQGLKKCNIK